jgi:DNA transformation protein and related proteins
MHCSNVRLHREQRELQHEIDLWRVAKHINPIATETKTMNKSNPSFAAHTVELLSPLGPVKSRPMFGGHNVSLDGLTFGLIAYDVLYLKADDENRPMFEKAGLGPFVYSAKDGKQMSMNYHAAPDCMDDWEAFGPWAKSALAAARRAKAPKKSAGQQTSPAKKPAAKKPAAKKPAAKKPVAKKSTAKPAKKKD